MEKRSQSNLFCMWYQGIEHRYRSSRRDRKLGSSLQLYQLGQSCCHHMASKFGIHLEGRKVLELQRIGLQCRSLCKRLASLHLGIYQQG